MKFRSINFFLIFLISLCIYTSENACDSLICDCQSGICKSCLISQFYLNSTENTCKLCPPQCKTCTSNQQCLTCRDMYFLQNNNCQTCQKYCKSCLSNTNCTTCIDGYVLVSGICQQCQVPNVQTCDSLLTVKTCQVGYWKNGDSCSSCRQFCILCTSSNNCLSCQSGYQAKVSAGTYCVACGSGCKTCTDSGCSQCLTGYRLVSGGCQIIANCSAIAHCTACTYTNSTIKCAVCEAPYFLADGACTPGASLLCSYANGRNAYQCLGGCSQYAYTSGTTIATANGLNQVVCLPAIWQDTGVQQIYFAATYIARYNSTFITPTSLSYYSICNSQYIFSKVFNSKTSTVKLSYTFPPYYKLNLILKLVPLYKSSFVSLNTTGLSLTITFTDNASNTFSFSKSYADSDLTACSQTSLSLSSKNIKDQLVNIEFSSLLSNANESQLSSYPYGLIGYRQIIIQYYRCDSKCRICSNTQYCLECYGSWFLSNNICALSCQGLFEFYLPLGNYVNYTSKYCISQCYDGYYSTVHPLKNNTFICLKCPEKCLTCKSQTQCLSCQSPYLYYSNNFSCLSTCPNTHYASVKTNQCVLCNAPCKTCLNQTKCLSCFIGYYDGNNCVGICPDGTYSSTSSKQCLTCDSKCSICQNNPTFCSSCNSPYKLLGTTCLDSCPVNSYYQVNGTCIACKSPCILCLSQTKCLTCSRGYIFNYTCHTDCPSGYYKDIANSKCNLCENNCLTCLSISICKTCVNGTYLYNSMCLQSCPLKTYINSQGVCTPCLPPCLTCINETSCITCSIGYLSQITLYKCLSQCQSGYFGQSSNLTCMKCDSSCLTCKQQAFTCLSCSPGLLLENAKCVAQCSIGNYAFNGQKCRPCSYPCETCVDLSSNCLTCHAPYILSSSNKCSLSCSSTQYQSNGTCHNCTSPCLACTDKTTCTSCALNSQNQTYLNDGGKCLTTCSKGMYADSLTLKCKTCVFPCSTCISSRSCTSCANGYLNQQKMTCEVCSMSYYADDSTKTCKLCSTAIKNCQQCQSGTICKLCEIGYYLLNNLCVSQSECQNLSGYFLNLAIKKCSQCSPPCGNCSSSTVCLSCLNGYLYQSKCIFTCPDGYYADLNSKICKTCNYSICATCQNSQNQCLSCLQTSATLNVYLPQNKTCIGSSFCGDTYYIDNSYGYLRCLKCISPCQKCSSASYCLSCVSGVLYKGACSYSCPNKYFTYDNQTSGVVACQQCSSSCLQCTSDQSNCISCPMTELLQDNECVTQCSSTYYLNEYILQCLKCQSPCLQCLSVSYCTSCINSSLILYYGQCINQCPEGSYILNHTCINCPSQCQICQYSSNTSSVVCQKCSLGLYMNSSFEGKCESSCLSKQYPDNQTRKCYSCQIPCNSCYTATKCKTCIDGYLIYNNQCLKGDQCPSGTYQNFFQKKCLDNCYSPYYGNPLIKKCSLNCSQKYLKVLTDNNRVCTKVCPSGYYVDKDYLCSLCNGNICDNLLNYEVSVKNIFNILYVRIKFSKDVLTTNIDKDSINLFISKLEVFSAQKQSSRLLATNNSIEQYNFSYTQMSSSVVWLTISTYESLQKSSVQVSFKDYYLLNPIVSSPSPSTNLQQLNYSVYLESYDQYTEEDKESAVGYEIYSQILSIVLLIITVIGLISNCLTIFYQLIDYFQIYFMILFLEIDYTPLLNYFFYGFRYSHYLFLPQIFRPSSYYRKEYDETPGKFGIIVPDADFLSNTGHDFLIIFIAITITVIAKLMDIILSGRIKNNKVTNDPNAGSSISLNKQQKQQYNKQQSDNNQKSSKQVSQVDGKNIITQQKSEKPTSYNIIELQILQGKHGRLVKYIKIFISRLKWNYFNDLCFCLYFYVVLFSYSQTLIIKQGNALSSLFAVLGIVLTFLLPVFLIYLINKNSQIIRSDNQYYLPLKTFYYTILPHSEYALYLVPIKYIRKLLIGMLLVYCSEFPIFVLGMIMMFSILNMIMNYLYQPFKLKFEIYIQQTTQFLFTISIFILSLIESNYVDFDMKQMMVISKIIVSIIILLTIILTIWNLIRITVEFLKQVTGIDWFHQYYHTVDDLSDKNIHEDNQSHHENTENEKNNYFQDKQLHQQSNVRLHGEILSPTHQISSFNHEQDQQSSESGYSGLDIYLKKQSDAPVMLIKCVKDVSDQDGDNQQSQQQGQSQQSSNISNQQIPQNHQNRSETLKQQTLEQNQGESNISSDWGIPKQAIFSGQNSQKLVSEEHKYHEQQSQGQKGQNEKISNGEFKENDQIVTEGAIIKVEDFDDEQEDEEEGSQS